MVIYNIEGRFESTFEEVDRQVQAIISRLKAEGDQYSAGFLFQLDFVLRELFNNAIEHGNQMEPSKSVWYTLQIRGTDMELWVRDEGKDFDVDQELQQEYQDDVFRIRKRGLATIAAMGFQINRRSGCTCVRLMKKIDDTNGEGGSQSGHKLS
ncbi:MAG TPA: ATP-binding protein [Bacillota bacterium]|nr:ATP-binding protein [Bacillota bacterium]